MFVVKACQTNDTDWTLGTVAFSGGGSTANIASVNVKLFFLISNKKFDKLSSEAFGWHFTSVIL